MVYIGAHFATTYILWSYTFSYFVKSYVNIKPTTTFNTDKLTQVRFRLNSFKNTTTLTQSATALTCIHNQT